MCPVGGLLAATRGESERLPHNASARLGSAEAKVQRPAAVVGELGMRKRLCRGIGAEAEQQQRSESRLQRESSRTASSSQASRTGIRAKP